MEKSYNVSEISQRLQSVLGADAPKIFSYELTDSTNERARKYASQSGANVSDGALFIARAQSLGRGRRGRSFLSDDGRGIYFTYLFKPDSACCNAAMITAYAAVCVCRAIEELAPVKAQIKWVNDVYLNGKKAAGILTEGEFLPASCEFSYVAVGIGVNLYSVPFPTELSAIATDVESQSGVKIDPCELIYKIIMRLRDFESEKNGFIEDYRRRSTLIGKAVTVELLSGSYSATVLGIDDEARLIIETADGITHLATGEVSVRAAEK